MTFPELDRVEVRRLDKSERVFDAWESLTITSEFLTPCDTFRLTCGSESAGVDLARELPVGAHVQILVNGYPQITGYVDACEVENDWGGTRVTIEGRDALSLIVDGNVDPNLQIPKNVTIMQLCELVIKGQYMTEFGFVPQNDSRVLARGTNLGEKPKEWKGSRHKRPDPLKEVTPKDNEGAFSYLSRIFSHHGYWLWASVDGQYVVVAGPDYEQPPSYELVKRYDTSGNGGTGAANNVLRSRSRLDQTSVPSVVYVRGVSSSAGAKGKVVGFAQDSRVLPLKPAFIKDQNATTQEKAERVARAFLSRQQRNFATYECTVAGFTDRVTKGIYQVDATAKVVDEVAGVEGVMWIESRTFRKSRSEGTVTDLKLIPCGTLVLDWQPGEAVPAVIDLASAHQKTGDDSPSKGEFVFGNPQTVTFMKARV